MSSIVVDQPHAATLKLTHDLLMGEGDNRLCYRHPHDRALCIKIHKPDGSAAGKRRRRLRRLRRLLLPGKTELSHNEREFHNYLVARRKAGEDVYRFAPRCHGLVLTTEGVGLVCDIIRDPDGRPSPSLSDFVQADPTAHCASTLLLVDGLQSFVLKYDFRFLFSFNPGHVLVQKHNGQTRLVLADWKGKNHELIPISSWFPFLARAKVRRRFDRLRTWIRHVETMAAAGKTP